MIDKLYLWWAAALAARLDAGATKAATLKTKNSKLETLLKMSLIFYSEKCIACGQCVEVCPFGVLRLEGETLVIGEGCNLCGACVEVCEVEALALPEATGPSPRPGRRRMASGSSPNSGAACWPR